MIEKVIKRTDGILYVKWKGYNNSFNSWIIKISVLVTKIRCESDKQDLEKKIDEDID